MKFKVQYKVEYEYTTLSVGELIEALERFPKELPE